MCLQLLPLSRSITQSHFSLSHVTSWQMKKIVFILNIFLITEIYIYIHHPSPVTHLISSHLLKKTFLSFFSVESLGKNFIYLQRENQSHKILFYFSCPSSLKLNEIKSFKTLNLVYKMEKLFSPLRMSL